MCHYVWVGVYEWGWSALQTTYHRRSWRLCRWRRLQKKKSDKKNEKEKDFHVLSFLFWLSPWILSVNSSGTLCSLNFLQQVASLSPSNKQTHTESDTQLMSDVCVSALSC